MQPMVLSYGEDPLTYLMLTSRLGEFLKAVGDGTAPSDVLVIYRPSFGRGMGAHKSKGQSTFGEFDGIVATKKAVYFIESKWHRSSETQRETAVIRSTQLTRHKILRWYRTHWSFQFKGNWDIFVERNRVAFEKEFPSSCLPPKKSILSKNIEFLLGQLEEYPPDIVDVLLFVGQKGSSAPSSVDQPFKLVKLYYEGMDGTGYFNMSSKSSD